MSRAPRSQTRQEGPPLSQPEGPPPAAYSAYDHSFTLQAVMEMQKTLGALSANMDRVRDDTAAMNAKLDSTCDKLDKINLKMAWLAGIVTACAFLGVVVWTVAGVIPWDRIKIEEAKK